MKDQIEERSSQLGTVHFLWDGGGGGTGGVWGRVI